MGILRPEGGGYVKPGDECDLRAEDENFATGPPSRASANPEQTNQVPVTGSNNAIHTDQLQRDGNVAAMVPRDPEISSADGHADANQFQSNPQYRPEYLSFLGLAGSNQLDLGNEPQDAFNPFFDLQPLSFFQDHDMPTDFGQFGGAYPINLDFYNSQQELTNA